MAQAYTPGLKVTPQVRWRARRVLPIAGEVLVSAGQTVAARDIVARTFMPGDVTPVNVAKLLSIPAADVPRCMLKPVGESVAAGEPLARSQGLFGLFRSEVKAPASGTIEAISPITGQVMLRGAPLVVQVRAYLSGTVVEVLPQEGVVVEADVALVQGIFGVGGEAYGPVRPVCDRPDQDLTEERLAPDLRGAVVIGGRRITQAAVRAAQQIGVAALVSGGIDDQDLREILGYDLGVAVTGNEALGLTLIITEGFGEIAMADRTFHLLRQHAGAEAAVNGATQIRAGVMRPEVVIPRGTAAAVVLGGAPTSGVLEPGVTVRVIREPYFGCLGTVVELPPEPRVLESESKARVVEVKLADGRRAVVPRANVELVES
uniref:RnfC Barrel sandwich hybrid domain-containing protein n=1 Tax=Schlesneria paludicola TaxID=360056 RepID=A0A7C4QK76_9PLAN